VYRTCCGSNESDQHIETGGFTGPIRPKETYNFPCLDVQIHPVDDVSFPVTFYYTLTGKNGFPDNDRGRMVGRAQGAF
jgi:hypothetical protein